MIGKGEARLLGRIIFVAPVRVYWKFIFCASKACDIIVNIYGFLLVNAQLLIGFGTAFYAIMGGYDTVIWPPIIATTYVSFATPLKTR